MSMTGRWIDQLTEQANRGDIAAQNTLRGAGLWETEEEAADRELEWHLYQQNETAISDGNEPDGKSFADERLPW